MAVPTGLATPAELAAWRLGMAHYAGFLRVAGRAGGGRGAARGRAGRGRVGAAGPLAVAMAVLTAC